MIMSGSNTPRRQNFNRQFKEREAATPQRSATEFRQLRGRQRQQKQERTWEWEQRFSSGSQKTSGSGHRSTRTTTGSRKKTTSGSSVRSGSVSGSTKQTQRKTQTHQESASARRRKAAEQQRQLQLVKRLRVTLGAVIVISLIILVRLFTSEPDDQALALSDSSASSEVLLTASGTGETAIMPAAPQSASPTPTPSPVKAYLASAGELPQSHYLDAQPLIQEPELPTGCESIALTIALKSLGYSLKKTTIADEYLIYSDTNVVAGFVGDPHELDGAGIFTPGLTLTANRYLQANGNRHTAYDISGTDFEDLLTLIAGGYPIVMWGTIDYEMPLWSRDTYPYQGKDYRWYYNEHCIMLSGYDLSSKSITIMDPEQGEIERSIEMMKGIYNEIGKYAITIM